VFHEELASYSPTSPLWALIGDSPTTNLGLSRYRQLQRPTLCSEAVVCQDKGALALTDLILAAVTARVGTPPAGPHFSVPPYGE
jgi:hypothetical protein